MKAPLLVVVAATVTSPIISTWTCDSGTPVAASYTNPLTVPVVSFARKLEGAPSVAASKVTMAVPIRRLRMLVDLVEESNSLLALSEHGQSADNRPARQCNPKLGEIN